MICVDGVTDIFYDIDEFCKVFEPAFTQNLIDDGQKSRKRPTIRVCKNKRICTNKVFKGIATTGKSTMGWFHGFKLHLIVNDKGEVLDFVITQGNVDDRAPLKEGNILNRVFSSQEFRKFHH